MAAQGAPCTFALPEVCTVLALAFAKVLPLAACSALRDVRIPPGPRLLILHHLNEMRRNVLTPSLPVGNQAALGSSGSHRK